MNNPDAITYDLTRRPYGSFEKILSPKETDILIEKIRNNPNDKFALDALTRGHLRLVAYLAFCYRNSINYEEAFNIALLGLSKSIRSYEISKEANFLTYTRVVIENEINQVLRKNKAYNTSTYVFSENYLLDIDDNETELEYQDTTEISLDEMLLNKEFDETLSHIIYSALDEIEQYAIIHNYGLYKNKKQKQEDIAKHFNVDQVTISRKIENAKQKIKTELAYFSSGHDDRLITKLQINFIPALNKYLRKNKIPCLEEKILLYYLGLNGYPKLNKKSLKHMFNIDDKKLSTIIKTNLLQVAQIIEYKIGAFNINEYLNSIEKLKFSSDDFVICSYCDDETSQKNKQLFIQILQEYLKNDNISNNDKEILAHTYGIRPFIPLKNLASQYNIPKIRLKLNEILSFHLEALSQIYNSFATKKTNFYKIADEVWVDAQINTYYQSINHSNAPESNTNLQTLNHSNALEINNNEK